MITLDKYRILIISIVFYMCTNILYRVIPSPISPNQIVGILIVLDLIWIYISDLRPGDVILVFYLLVISCMSILFCEDKSLNFEHSLYFSVTILLLWKMKDKDFREKMCLYFVECKKTLTWLLVISMVAVIISLPFSSSYTYGFTSFAQGAHPFSSGLMLMFTVYLLIIYDEPITFKTILPLIIICVGICMGAARSYLISLAILIIVFYFIKANRASSKIIFLVVIAAAVIYILPNTTIFERFGLALQQGTYSDMNNAGAVTSGRTVFWKLDIEAFLNKGILEQLFGSGFDFIYDYNKENYGLRIWAHNDFIHIINSIGIVGLCVYIYVLFVVLRNTIADCRYNKGRIKHPAAILIGYVFIMANINGLYTYQQYLYSTFFLLCLLTYDANFERMHEFEEELYEQRG